MSSNLNNFRQLNINEMCSNITQIAPTSTGDTLHYMYHAQKRNADAEYLGRVKIVLSSCMGGIHFADPASIRKAHKELMTQVRTEAIHISNKYKNLNRTYTVLVGQVPLHFRKGFTRNIE